MPNDKPSRTYYVDTTQLKIKLAVSDLTNISKLSRETGISSPILTALIRRGRRPTSGTIIRLASVLELSTQEVADIFFASDLRNS